MKIALITGITGQDGSYMAELLLTKGYHVIGVVRPDTDLNAIQNIDFLQDIEIVCWNMSDEKYIKEVLLEYKPSEIYNFAAYSSVETKENECLHIGDLNGLVVARILEAIRSVDINIRFCQASSSEIFGNPFESPQSESTPLRPRNFYGAAKIYAHSLVGLYRQQYNLFGCSAILYNHESPRRGPRFVTRKITQMAVKIKLGLENELHLGNLDAQRDGGVAGDYVRGMWLMLQQSHSDDYVLATGKTHSVREFCKEAFAYLELDYRNYVREDLLNYRPCEQTLLVGNPIKAERKLGWSSEIDFKNLVAMMVDADFQLLK